ncbi:MAG: error-prone DNA polymerase [Marinobacter sp.]|nr:error-prone DNA polymerase [Marinobacter sp.]
MSYAELHCITNFTFLRGASHPEELTSQAQALGYSALAITDECSVAGIPRAWRALKHSAVKLIVGSEFQLRDGPKVILLAENRHGYAQLCQLITLARRRADKGHYQLFTDDLFTQTLTHCLLLWQPDHDWTQDLATGARLIQHFSTRCWLKATRYLAANDSQRLAYLQQLATSLQLPVIASGDVQMHCRQRQPLQDVLTALRHHCTVAEAGFHLQGNAERYLRPIKTLQRLFPSPWLAQTLVVAGRCSFCPSELRYEYPGELVPQGFTASQYLRALTRQGEQRRFPGGTPVDIQALLEKELSLITELGYEPYFLTLHDIVSFARQQGILCQGRGSAANSAVCYCLDITEVDPRQVDLLFERFISRERDEPPDIDVDFEHERREEVIQYIYQRYGRHRAALAATVIRYRPRSAIRDVGKALGLDLGLVEQLLSGLDWRDRQDDWRQQLLTKGLVRNERQARQFMTLVNMLLGFPRHMSQHVGGFVISAGPMSELVPIENATMADRTVIQWDKDDLESLGLMKVDILALGMLSAIRKSLDYLRQRPGAPHTLQEVPAEDPATYAMLQQGDSIGVFQVESRAQINMLPRLKPATYYDLVIQVAIVRPGPIQGDMVHPYLRRRAGLEPVSYPNDALRSVLGRTQGVPIFQEQAIRLAMVAAGFSAGEADQLRRAMAAWKSHGDLTPFRDKLISGMLARGYEPDFAERLYQQLCGFGGYGFPESHAASFALLVYVSAWLKCHYPAEFYCGLLNSQPMGFYSPSQLVQDARRHQVAVRPVDINLSDWDHRLAHDVSPPALQLGFRLIKGLSANSAQRIVESRPPAGYQQTRQLRDLAQLSRQELETLASANALASIAGHRHQARWDILGHDHQPAPLFVADHSGAYRVTENAVQLPPPTEGENVLDDYHSQGLTLRRHPLALLRGQGHLRHCLTATALQQAETGRPVAVAGLVTGRQRPGTASGVTFVTLEDETGNINVVVWLKTARQQRKPLLTAKLLHVKGILEREGQIAHVIAGRLTDLSHLMRQLQISSRDFQ